MTARAIGAPNPLLVIAFGIVLVTVIILLVYFYTRLEEENKHG